MASTLSQKLQLKPGMALALLNPPADYAAHLQAEGVAISAEMSAPAGMLFASTLAEALGQFPHLAAAVRPGGLVWVAYPKQASGVKTDINRDTLWQATKGSGWHPVRQVALDETWSAIRFRPDEPAA